jgi:serine/threonine protein kinase
MGEVYRARDAKLNRDIALMFLPTDSAGDPLVVERFRREARAIAALNHPQICTIHDISEVPSGPLAGRPFIVMEYLDGESLAARLQRSPGRSLPVDEVLRVASEIADALHAAHANGIVHRDLKSANLLLTTRGQAKILDFGLAKHAEVPDDGGERQALAVNAERRELTERGSAVGTVSYMSPEQALGLTVDARSHLFSFGIVLYEMTAGARPSTPVS